MTNNTEEIDIAQRIAEALSRTSEPRPTSDCLKRDGDEVVGSVPVHLRHLHNLLDELRDETLKARRGLRTKEKRLQIVRNVFFNALETRVIPERDNVKSLTILGNWDVSVEFDSDDDGGDELGDLGEMLRRLVADNC